MWQGYAPRKPACGKLRPVYARVHVSNRAFRTQTPRLRQATSPWSDNRAPKPIPMHTCMVLTHCPNPLPWLPAHSFTYPAPLSGQPTHARRSSRHLDSAFLDRRRQTPFCCPKAPKEPKHASAHPQCRHEPVIELSTLALGAARHERLVARADEAEHLGQVGPPHVVLRHSHGLLQRSHPREAGGGQRGADQSMSGGRAGGAGWKAGLEC
jgi:hypothetical protein